MSKNNFNRVLILSALIMSLFLFVSCSHKEKTVEIRGETMGTFYSVKIAGNFKSINKTELKSEIDSLLNDLNMKMSTYIPQSEISKFNNYRDTSWFNVSGDFAFVTKRALQIAEETNGAYDVTVGPLVNLWGFGPENKADLIPTKKEIDSVKRFVGYGLIQVKENPPAIRKLNSNVYLDLSSIAKGFGVDVVSEFLAQKGLRNHLVEIGGELRSSGRKFGKDWIVGVENPKLNKVAVAVPLNNESIATSGDYYNYFIYKGEKYSHSINPKTGYPVKHSLASVSVIYPDCMTADAYATAIEVLGAEKGFRFAVAKNLPVYLIKRDNEKLVVKMTELFGKKIKNKE